LYGDGGEFPLRRKPIRNPWGKKVWHMGEDRKGYKVFTGCGSKNIQSSTKGRKEQKKVPGSREIT